MRFTKAAVLALACSLPAAAQVVNSGSGTASGATPGNNTICSLGDSLVSLNDGTGAAVDTQYGPNFFSAMLLLNGGQWQFVHNGGVPGQLTNQILARLQADTLSQPCHTVLVLAGTNDVNSSIPAATTHSNLLNMWNGIVANGQTPVLVTIPPYNGNFYAQVAALNAWIRGEAAKLKLPLLDLYALVIDPTTGNYLPGYSIDGVHPNYAALRLIAQSFNPQFANLLGPYRATLPFYNSDPGNLFPNALNLTSSGGFATGWAKLGTNANYSYSLGTDPNIAGNAIVITKTATAAGDSGGESGYYVTSGYAAGDQMAFTGKIVTSGAEAGNLTYAVQLFGFSAGFASNTLMVSPTYYFSGTDLPNGQWYLPFTMPANTAILQVQVTVTTGTGTVKVGQMGLYDVTAAAL